jgi:hypothetical protein
MNAICERKIQGPTVEESALCRSPAAGGLRARKPVIERHGRLA